MKWELPENKLRPGQSIVDYILQQRGVEDKSVFLDTNLDRIHGWRQLHDTQVAADQILAAIAANRKIVIHGDYDADGVCATSLLWDFLYRKCQADVLPYIPSRFDEGYGLTDSSVQACIELGAELIITVDCGIKDEEIISKYSDQGVEFIVTDHHTLPTDVDGIPRAIDGPLSIVHPGHPQGNYPFRDIAGTTVAWKLVQAINEIGEIGCDTDDYLDLVAIATVCDVMPLIDENRAIVHHGLETIKSGSNIGLGGLLRIAGINPNELQTYHLGYAIGPRLNAAGRMEDAMHSVRLLTTNSSKAAIDHAQTLDSFNKQRQQVTTKLMSDAEAMIAAADSADLHFVYGEGWPEGIVGLVAGKLTEKYNRPTIVGSLNDGKIVASARSIKGFNIAEHMAKIESELDRYGGHELAAGMTVQADRAEAVRESLQRMAAEALDEEMLTKRLRVDAEVPASMLSTELVYEMEQLAPFGFGNPNIVLAVRGLSIGQLRPFGQDQSHLGIKTNEGVDLTAFRIDPDLKESLRVGGSIDVAGNLSIRIWRDRTYLQLITKDIITR